MAKEDRYWNRESTALGRAYNDVVDGARTLSNRVQSVLPGRTASERKMFQRAIREDREEKQWMRQHYKETGQLETRDEVAAEKHYAQNLARRSSTEIANGWTQKEAEAMNVHLDTKATKEWERSEPDHASVRKAERMADATDPMHDARREQQADNYKRQENNMKSTLAEKKEADIEYWKGVIRRDRVEITEAAQKVQASERNAEQPQAEAAVERQVKKATSKITPVVVAAMATSFVVNAQAQDINFLEQASRARNESMHVPQQKPLPAQPEQLLPPTPGLTCARVDQWQPVRVQPSDAAPVLGYTQAQIAVEGAAGGGYAHVRYYNGKEGYLPQTSLKPSRTCSIAGVRPNGGPVFQYKAG